MPTAIPSNEKNAFISIVQAAPFPNIPQEVARLQDILNNYEDIYTCICRQLDNFASNIAYITQAIAAFNNNALQAVGIWNEINLSSPPITDPVMIINSDLSGDYVELTLHSPWVSDSGLVIINSKIGKVFLDSYVDLQNLYIGPGSIVDVLDGSQPGAYINELWMPFLRNTPAILNKAIPGTVIGKTNISDGSYFGGYSNDDPQNICAIPVGDLKTGAVTHNTVPLTWTPPSMFSLPQAYLFINVYFRKQGENTWVRATDADGVFNGESGFTFTCLEEDTYYDFRILVTCLNGGISAPADVSIQTNCCN